METDTQQTIPTVLIVDDNSKNLQIIALILRELNYKIIIAIDGPSAIDLVERVRPDLVLLDVMMPEMDGFEACQLIKSKPENQNIPIIFLTALSEKANIVKGFKMGGVDYITKPFNKEELISRVKTHLELKFAHDEMQRMTDHLTDLNSIKDKMFSVIGHDLRSPIGSIKMILSLLSNQVEKYKLDEFRDTFGMLTKTADEVFGLLENLLGWARSQSGNQSFEPENIDVSSTVKNVYLLNKDSINIKHLHFEQDIEEGLHVFADLNMLKTVLRNLLSNALKYTPEGGTIRISAINDKESVKITVTDNGVGIPDENIPKLFDEKQHITTYGTNNETGSGIGLILCHNFIKINNGRLSVDSQVGRGSAFTMELPSKR